MKRFDDGSKSLYSINRDSVHELGLYVLARPVAHNVACITGNSIAIDLYTGVFYVSLGCFWKSYIDNQLPLCFLDQKVTG